MILVSDLSFQDFPYGGAEQVNDNIMKEIPGIEFAHSKGLVPDPDNFYIFSNLIQNLPLMADGLLLPKLNYIIIEHDYKFCVNRNPYAFSPDGIVPSHEQRHLAFYANAKAVVCQTPFHKSMFIKNSIAGNIVNFELGWWSEDDLHLLNETRFCAIGNKDYRYLVYHHDHPWKGTKAASDLCIRNGWDYEIIDNHPDRPDFLASLASYSTLVFLPQQPETCGRLVVEARCLDMNVITTPTYGASTHPWFKLSGEILVNKLWDTQGTNKALLLNYLP